MSTNVDTKSEVRKIKIEEPYVESEENVDLIAPTSTAWDKTENIFSPEETYSSQLNVTAPQLGHFEFVSKLKIWHDIGKPEVHLRLLMQSILMKLITFNFAQKFALKF